MEIPEEISLGWVLEKQNIQGFWEGLYLIDLIGGNKEKIR